MKKLSKKTKLSLAITICIVIILIILAILLFLNQNTNNNGRILFKSSYYNNAWEPTNYGYYIYSKGVIEEFDEYNKTRKLKSAKITDEELNQLKELANTIEDKEDNAKNETNSSVASIKPSDSGYYRRLIYSDRLAKWVKLNSSETGKKISELTNQLHDKYLGED